MSCLDSCRNVFFKLDWEGIFVICKGSYLRSLGLFSLYKIFFVKLVLLIKSYF